MWPGKRQPRAYGCARVPELQAVLRLDSTISERTIGPDAPLGERRLLRRSDVDGKFHGETGLEFLCTIGEKIDEDTGEHISWRGYWVNRNFVPPETGIVASLAALKRKVW